MGGIGYGLVESVEVISGSRVCSGVVDNVPSLKYGASAAYVPADNVIIMCGGYDNYQNLAECHQLSLDTGAWTDFPSLSQARYRLSLTYLGDQNKMIAIAGNNEAQAATNTVEMIDLSDDTPQWVDKPQWRIPKVIFP